MDHEVNKLDDREHLASKGHDFAGGEQHIAIRKLHQGAERVVRMAKNLNQMMPIRAIAAGEPILDGSFAGVRPAHDGFDGVMGVAQLLSERGAYGG